MLLSVYAAMSTKQDFRINIYSRLFCLFLALLLIYAVLRLGFYWVNLSLFPDIDAPSLLTMMLGGVKFDVAALIYLNSLFILMQAIPFKFRYNTRYQRVSKWVFITTNTIGIALNLVDFAYYKFTLKRTTGTVFNQFSNEDNKFTLFTDFLVDYWYLLITLIGLALLLNLLYTRIQVLAPKSFNTTRYLVHGGALILIVLFCIIGVRGGWRHSTRPITLNNAGDYVDRPEQMYIVLNTPFSIIRTLDAVDLKPKDYYSEDELSDIYSPIHQPDTVGAFKPLNVVLLIIESLGKEHIGVLNKDLDNGNYKGYTPFLDSLIEEGYTFTRTFANGRKSIDALPAIISGIPSISEPYVLSIYSGNKTNSLPSLLGKKGYETAFFHGAPNGSMGFSAYAKLAGFQHYFGKDEYNNNADFDGIWGIWDEPFLQYVANTTNTLKEPFFTTFFSLSSHHPFKVPEKYEGKFPEGNLPVQKVIGYTDQALRKFFDTAKKQPWYENTLFVLCADHATVSYYPEYQTTLGGYSIPIVFYYPGGELQGASDNIVQQIDIMPTVLNYLNYDEPYFAFGFDAFSENSSNFMVNNNGSSYLFVQGNYLLISDIDRSIGLYNISNDPMLKENKVGASLQVQDSLEKHLKAFIQQYNNRMINNELVVK